jgi:hypothetical protein
MAKSTYEILLHHFKNYYRKMQLMIHMKYTEAARDNLNKMYAIASVIYDMYPEDMGIIDAYTLKAEQIFIDSLE